MALKPFKVGPKHHKFLADLKAQMPSDTEMPPHEQLAIASQFVGQLIALQNPLSGVTAEIAMDIVSRNIEVGNQAAMLTMTRPEGEA